MATEIIPREIEERLDALEGRFPKNSLRSTMEGHVHKPPVFASHARLHAMSDVLDHSGAISAAQHGTPAGDLHTGHALLAGRAGIANNLRLSTDSTGILTGSGASAGVLRLVGTDHATPGRVEVQRASVTASIEMFRGLIGAEANSRWAFGFDASSLVQLGLGAGGATAQDLFLRRTAVRALRLVSNNAALLPSFGARDSGDTADSWTLDSLLNTDYWPDRRGRFGLGGNGTTAPDAFFSRGGDAGVAFLQSVLAFNNVVTIPTFTPVNSPGAGFAELVSYLYARVPSGISGNSSRLYYQSEGGGTFTEIGPLGLLRGLLRQINVQIGGMEVTNATGLVGVTGLDLWGILGGSAPGVSGFTSPDAAYAGALTLTANITATQANFDISGGGPLQKGDVLVIGTEKIAAIQTAGNNIIASIRGYMGTTAAAHLAGAAVTLAGGSIRCAVSSDGEPCFELDTGTTINQDAALEWPQSHTLHSASLLIYKFDLRHVLNLRLFIGFTNQSRATMLASDNPAGEYWGLSFSTARGDTQFKAVAKDGTTQEVVSVGLPPTTDSGTADVAVTTTNTTLTDTREAWVTNQWIGATVTCNGKTMVVTLNDATTLTGASWSGGGNPGNGNLWSLVLAATPTVATKYYVRLEYNAGGDYPSISLFDAAWNQLGTTIALSTNPPSLDNSLLRLVAGARNTAAATKRMRHYMASMCISPSVA